MYNVDLPEKIDREQIAKALAATIISSCSPDLDPWLTFRTFRPALEALILEHLGESEAEKRKQ